MSNIFKDFFTKIFSEDSFEPTEAGFFDQAAVAELLEYRGYDPVTGLYYNDETTGFIFEITPRINVEPIIDTLHSAVITNMPASAGMQVVNWTSPDVDTPIARWASHRTQGGGIVSAISEKRTAHMNARRYGVDYAIKSIPCNRRVFICGWLDGDVSKSEIAELIDFQRSLLAVFELPRNHFFPPDKLLSVLAEMLHAETWGAKAELEYSEEVPINAQVPGSSLAVGTDHIELNGTPLVATTVASVAKFPPEWLPHAGHSLLGDPDILSDRPHGPVLSSMAIMAIPQEKASSDILAKTLKLQHSHKTGFSKFMHDPVGKEKELSNLTLQLDAGERMFHSIFSVVAYTEGAQDEVRAAGNEIHKIYRSNQFAIRHEKFLQLPLFVGSLPLGQSKKRFAAFQKMQRTRLLKGKAAVALAPIHGEWIGNARSGVLLTGRQGQVFSWNNFVSDGNYNVAVVGKSGAGKSVFMQELASSIYASGGRVLIIDDGYSFKTSCDILGGKHIAFSKGNELRLNPFSLLQTDKMDETEYVAEAIELITRIIGSMAALGEQREGRVEGIEEEAISLAVMDVWAAKQSSGEITDVYDILLARVEEDLRLRDVCRKLKAFTRHGIYGVYFSGAANIKIDGPFTVVELSDIKTQPVLEQVVLQIVMFLGTELMFKTDRATPVAIIIDEAWDLLKGTGTAKFIEGVVRRARKYTGALITGTQSLDDYYANPAAEVCLQNSDWMVVMAQKPDTLDKLDREGKISAPTGFVQRLKTLKSIKGEFSEMAIKGPEGWFFARLLLDPFSLAVFSSKGSTVQQLEKRKAEGMETVAAIEDMVAKGEVA